MTEFRKVPLDQIHPSPFQMRGAIDEAALDQLAESLERDGQQRPVKLRSVEGGYETVFGHRIIEAARRKNWTSIDAVIEELTDEQVMWAQYAENSYREDISLYDKAKWIQSMKERFGYNQQTLALRMNVSDAWISDVLKFVTVEKHIKSTLIRLLTLKHVEAILEAPSDLLGEVCKEIEEYHQRTHGIMIPWYDIPELINYVIAVNAHPELAAPPERLREEARSLAEEERLEEEEVDELELDQEKQAEELAREEMLFPEPRRTVVEEPKKVSMDMAPSLSEKYPAAAEYVADYFAKNFRPDLPFLRWSLTRKFGISDTEAAGLIKEVKAEPGRIVVEPPKPLVKKIIIAEGVCPECGKKFLVNHLSTGEHTIEYPKEGSL